MYRVPMKYESVTGSTQFYCNNFYIFVGNYFYIYRWGCIGCRVLQEFLNFISNPCSSLWFHDKEIKQMKFTFIVTINDHIYLIIFYLNSAN